MRANEFEPDYNIETLIMGKADIDEISNILTEIDTISSNVEDARKINKLVLQCHVLICNWACPQNGKFNLEGKV
ncbi:hypothetical protein LCGC14_0400260 [marine sediment metagenome]|uniref:Uncharacterized protein n=1 Tax=marine sediment metagenome TaxID=412755 RepID=A0A0F9VIV9_9ZZZZ